MKIQYSLPWFFFGVIYVCLAGVQPTQAEEVQLSLLEAINSALENNLNLQLRKEDVLESQGVTQSAWGKFDAFFSAEAGRQHQTITPLTAGAAEEQSTTSWSAGLQKRFTPGTEFDLTWKNGYQDTSPQILLFDPAYTSTLVLGISQPLLKGFGNEVQMADIEVSEKQKEAAEHLVNSETADLVAEVKKTYWEFVYSWQDIEVQKLSLNLAQKLLEEVQEKIRIGRLAEVEIYRPQSEVARREESLISGERAIGLAEDNLKFLINSTDWNTSYTPKNHPDEQVISPKLSLVLTKALANRPDLQAAKLQTRAAQITVKNTKNKQLPDLALVGSIGTGGTDDSYSSSLDNSFHNQETLWSVGVNFSVPINNSLAKGEHRQARAILKKTQTNEELLRQQIKRTVRTTARDVHLAIKAMEATKKTSLASLKGLEAEQIKFDAGRATSLDVLVAQENYAQALSQENRAKITYAQTLAELDRIQGVITLPL